MGKAYSGDLRDRVVAHIYSGHSRRAASGHFGVSARFAMKLAERVAAKGTVETDRLGRPGGTGKLSAHMPDLIAWAEAKLDITMPELSAQLLAAKGVSGQLTFALVV